MNQETWKDVKDYEGLYQVSDLGSVRSLQREIVRSDMKPQPLPGVDLKLFEDRYGYLFVVLKNQGKNKKITVHRLVALHFLDNPKNLPVINHKKGNKKDNRAIMLEWTSISANTQHSYDNGFQKALKGSENPSSLSVKMIDKYSFKTLKIFGSIREASRETNTHQASLSRCINGRQETAGGYMWKFNN